MCNLVGVTSSFCPVSPPHLLPDFLPTHFTISASASEEHSPRRSAVPKVVIKTGEATIQPQSSGSHLSPQCPPQNPQTDLIVPCIFKNERGSDALGALCSQRQWESQVRPEGESKGIGAVASSYGVTQQTLSYGVSFTVDAASFYPPSPTQESLFPPTLTRNTDRKHRQKLILQNRVQTVNVDTE